MVRLDEFRPMAVGYLWTIAAALILTGTTNLHPQLGRLWDLVVSSAAATLAVVPFVRGARARAVLVGWVAFVILFQAEEWIRLFAPPLGLAIAALWIAALIGVVSAISADQEIKLGKKLGP